MTQSVTLRTPSGDIRDGIGGSTPTYASMSTTMYIEPKTGTEEMADRNTPIGDWLGIGRKDVNFDSWDQIVYGTHVFDIVSPVRPFYNPTTLVISHIEMDLQEVT
jgi:hypothetical protein